MSPPEQSEPGVPFVPWAIMWLLAGAVAWSLVVFDLVHRNPGHVMGRDFSNLWVAGKLALSGHSDCIFQLKCFQSRLVESLGVAQGQNYSYPPHALFVAVPFALLPYYAALVAWTASGILFFTACAKPYLPSGFPQYLPAFTAAGWLNIWDGQYGFLLGGLWLLFFSCIDQRPARAGLMAGLLTFKPHLGLMIAVTALKRPIAIATAIASIAGLVLLSAILFGPKSWSDFLLGTSAAQINILTTRNPEIYFRMMPSAYVAFGRGAVGAVAQAAFAIAAIGLLWRGRRWNAFSACTATILIVPYVFNYDMTVVSLGFAILLYRHWHRLLWFQRAGLGFAFCAPELTFFLPLAVPLALLYGLKMQLELCGEPADCEQLPKSTQPMVAGAA